MEAIKFAKRPGICNKFDFINEPLVSVQEYFNGRVQVDPVYYRKGIDGAVEDMRLRKSVIDHLETALSLLPDEYTFKIFDAWRPLSVQQVLFDDYFKRVSVRCSGFPREIIIDEVERFVTTLSSDIEKPFVHATGGAVDLTVINKNTGDALDMGTEFDDFLPSSGTCYFEKMNPDIRSEDVLMNRRLLYWTMINAGFTNFPSEWWHYDFGNAFWGFYSDMPVMYKGIFD